MTLTLYTPARLMEEHQQNVALIERIKTDVSKENDINNTVPLFQQLETA